MDQEIQLIKKNDTWELTNLAPGANNIGVKWICKTMCNEKVGKDKVYKLRKTQYGLRQAPRLCYSKIESYFYQERFKKMFS